MSKSKEILFDGGIIEDRRTSPSLKQELVVLLADVTPRESLIETKNVIIGSWLRATVSQETITQMAFLEESISRRLGDEITNFELINLTKEEARQRGIIS